MPYQVSIEFYRPFREYGPKTYIEFLSQLEEIPAMINVPKAVGEYDDTRHVYCGTQNSETALELARKALGSGLVKTVHLDKGLIKEKLPFQ